MKILFLILAIFLFSCSDIQDLAAQEVEKKTIDKLKLEIVSFVENAICSEDNNCNFVGLGSKPCGGHWEFIVYSSSIDTVKLLSMVEDYNQMEKGFNQKWEILSDCSFLAPPDSVICDDGKCKAVFSN